ncbi:MAG: phosphate acyltransferase [Candidatus Humimicrobiaceae bacterium]
MDIEKKSMTGSLVDLAGSIEKKIVFSDGNDIRLIKALDYFKDHNKSSFTLIGNESQILQKLNEEGIKDRSRFSVFDPSDSDRNSEYGNIVKSAFEKRGKEITEQQVRELLLNNSYIAAIKLKNSEADCAVGGSISSTGDLMKAVIHVLGLGRGKKFLSSSAYVEVPDSEYGVEGKFFISDPGIIPKPTEEQLLDMTLSTYETAKPFFGDKTVVALLSYSTKGSAKSEEIDMISRVAKTAKQIRPEMVIDGEMQLDAAIVPEVCARKAPDSPVKGMANVLIFPDLNAANISFKIIQRLAKASVCGPIVQGAAKPFNDLSRGCTVEEIIALTAMALIQRKSMEDDNLV